MIPKMLLHKTKISAGSLVILRPKNEIWSRSR